MKPSPRGFRPTYSNSPWHGDAVANDLLFQLRPKLDGVLRDVRACYAIGRGRPGPGSLQ